MADIWVDVDTAITVPVNKHPLIDDTDFKSREVSVAYNAAGMDLVWNFITSAGVITQTAVTPTTGGDYDWSHVGDGMYKIEMPASGGASINNNTEGYGWFSGIATGVLPWSGPVIGFRAAAMNDTMTDSAAALATASALAALQSDISAFIAAEGTVDNTGATSTSFRTSLTAGDDHYNDLLLIFTSGALAGQAKPISDYANTNGQITLGEALTAAPANGVTFSIIAFHVHPISQIQSGLATAADLATVDTVVDAIKAKTDNLPGDPADASDIASAFSTVNGTLSTIASYIDTEVATIISNLSTLQTSVDDLPTNAELATALAGADDAVLDAIAALNNISAAQVLQQAKDAIVFYDLDHLLAAAYDPASKPGNAAGLLNVIVENDAGVPRFTANVLELAPTGGSAPSAADIRAEIDSNSTQLAAIKAKTDLIPSDPADASDISTAFGTVNSTLATIAGYVDTEVAAIKAKTDLIPSDPADASDIAAAFGTVNSTLSTIASYIDTEVAAIKAVTDKMDTTLVLNGSVYRFTAEALALSPSGSVEVNSFSLAALLQLLQTDTGETTADPGSVAKIAQGAAGGNVTVEAFTAEALDDLEAIFGSVIVGPAAAAISNAAPSMLIGQTGTELVLIRGEAYLDAISNAVVAVITDSRLPGTVTSDGTTVYMRIKRTSGGHSLLVQGTIDSYAAGVATCSFEFTAAQTAALVAGNTSYKYTITFLIEGVASNVLVPAADSPVTVRPNGE